MHGKIRDIDKYTRMIRDRGMIPGLSTHMPEAVTIADATNADVETYIQLYNAAGFLMQVEADWVMRIIRNARKPVMTIKPLAAGRILPPVGLAFVWNTIRNQDMVAIGTTTPDEAREVIDLRKAFMDYLKANNPVTTTGLAADSWKSRIMVPDDDHSTVRLSVSLPTGALPDTFPEWSRVGLMTTVSNPGVPGFTPSTQETNSYIGAALHA